jgi:hypothetical protein
MQREKNPEGLPEIDAGAFQQPLSKLAEVMAQKVKREANAKMSAPPYVCHDLFALTRKAMRTYDLIFYLHADERREGDCYWRKVYSIESYPLIRGMIDVLFNITLILQAPGVNGKRFRLCGFKRALQDLERERKQYGGKPEWDNYIGQMESHLDFEIRRSDMTVSEVRSSKDKWPTLGMYLRPDKTGLTTHQRFLDRFTYHSWAQYSSFAHGAFEGLLPFGAFYTEDALPHEERPKLDAVFPRIMSMHMGRTATLLLCIATEIQLHFRFADEGARINQRLHEMWGALQAVVEAKELFVEHYEALLRERGINP